MEWCRISQRALVWRSWMCCWFKLLWCVLFGKPFVETLVHILNTNFSSLEIYVVWAMKAFDGLMFLFSIMITIWHVMFLTKKHCTSIKITYMPYFNYFRSVVSSVINDSSILIFWSTCWSLFSFSPYTLTITANEYCLKVQFFGDPC